LSVGCWVLGVGCWVFYFGVLWTTVVRRHRWSLQALRCQRPWSRLLRRRPQRRIPAIRSSHTLQAGETTKHVAVVTVIETTVLTTYVTITTTVLT
jgi:hypothetical protein